MLVAVCGEPLAFDFGENRERRERMRCLILPMVVSRPGGKLDSSARRDRYNGDRVRTDLTVVVLTATKTCLNQRMR